MHGVAPPCAVKVTAHRRRSPHYRSARYSRPQNGWLWPIDRAGHLVPFRRQPLRSVEFAAGPFASPPFICHACCLRARGSNEYSFHGYFAVRKPARRGKLTKRDVADPLQIDHAPLGRGVALDVALCG
jgi:hypothetical protein